MGRPRKDAFDENTTDRVLHAAEEVFADNGFTRARLEDIGARASIRRSSLLYHFGSKENLYQRVVERAFAEIASAIARGMGREGTFEEKVEATVDQLLTFEREHRALMIVVFRALLDPSAIRHHEIGERFVRVVDELEAFVTQQGLHELPPNLPVRATLMQLIVSQLARAAMGDVGKALWGGDAHTRDLARLLLLGRQPPA